MDKFFKYTRSIIAILMVVGTYTILIMLIHKKVPTENQDVLKIAIGAVLAGLSFVGGYYFGSSKDKSDLEESERPIKVKSNLKESEPPKQI